MSGVRRLLNEIHRRSVWQVSAIYLASGWTVFTVVLDLTDALLLPEWVPRYALVLLGLGLPLIVGTSYVQKGVGVRGMAATTHAGRLLTWRNVLGGGVLAFAALGAVTALRVVIPAPPANAMDGVGPARLAIFPATVRGSADPVLHEGIVDVLRGRLAVLEDLQIVDPGTVIKAARMKSEQEVVDVARAASIAEEHGWSLFVLPVISTSEGEIRIQATMFNTASPEKPLALAEAGGSVEDVFEHMDRLSVDLVFAQFGRASARLVRSAAQMTDSDAAWNAFLRGEQAMRRSQHDVALEAFQHAVEEDPSFALAYLRIAVVVALIEADGAYADLVGMAPHVLPRARALQNKLGEREREFLDAFAAFRAGDADRAETGFRAMLAARPGDLEARFFLAQTLRRQNPARGRSALEALPVFWEVLRADPDFTCPI
jgi:tetratricopeptide (TPR) repeat protein